MATCGATRVAAITLDVPLAAVPKGCTNLLELLLSNASTNQFRAAESFFRTYLSLIHSRISHLIEPEC
jgi:hypothetical protein